LSGERWAERIPPADGLEAFERLLQPIVAGAKDTAVQVGVLAADWPLFLDEFDGQEPPLFREIARGVRRCRPAAVAVAPAVERPASLARELEKAPASRRPAIVRAHIRRMAAGVLGVSDVSTIELQQPLRELGLDSLMAVQLRNEMAKALDRPLPATLLFEFPTVKALVDFASAAIGLTPESGATPAPAAAVSLTSFENATDDELADALAARLDQLGQQ
jgi:acyl carrier protein